MGLLRHRHDGPEPVRFRMQEKMFSIGDDSWIEDEEGNRVFKVDGKAMRIRDTFILKDMSDAEVAKIPFGRLGTVDEVARVITFVASPAASWVTGVNLIVDGGYTKRVQL